MFFPPTLLFFGEVPNQQTFKDPKGKDFLPWKKKLVKFFWVPTLWRLGRCEVHNTATSALKDDKARKALELADEICHLDEGNERQKKLEPFIP